jgi:cation diffusion facilitator CzcD-associated flavoprotein CzcO
MYTFKLPLRGIGRLLYRLPPLRKLLRWFIYFSFEKNYIVVDASHTRARGIAIRDLNRFVSEQIADESLRERSTPKYFLGCKRVLLSDNWYSTLQRDNVQLVDSKIDKVVAEGVVVQGKLIPTDVLILCSGFSTQNFVGGIPITGRNGVSLDEQWRANNGVSAFYGITVSNFPNMCILYGPNTNLLTNSILFMLECQVNYTISLVRHTISSRLNNFEVKQQVQETYQNIIEQKQLRMSWSQGCENWYKTADNKYPNNWPFSTIWYWFKTRHFAKNDYTFQ